MDQSEHSKHETQSPQHFYLKVTLKVQIKRKFFVKINEFCHFENAIFHLQFLYNFGLKLFFKTKFNFIFSFLFSQMYDEISKLTIKVPSVAPPSQSFPNDYQSIPDNILKNVYNFT